MTNLLPITFLQDAHYTVVSADEPAIAIVPGFLTYEEATAQANTLIDLTGLDYIVVDADELES